MCRGLRDVIGNCLQLIRRVCLVTTAHVSVFCQVPDVWRDQTETRACSQLLSIINKGAVHSGLHNTKEPQALLSSRPNSQFDEPCSNLRLVL